MPNEDWFYARNNEQHGPLSFEDLHHLVSSRELGRDDLVWQVGSAGWVPVGAVPALIQAAGGALSAPPLPAPAPWATFEQQYGPRLQDLRGRLGELDKATGALEALPHLRLVNRLLDYIGRQVGVHQLDLADLLMKRVGSLAYIVTAVLYAVYFGAMSLRADSIQMLVATALIVIPGASLCHYVAVHFLETSKEILDRTPTELSSNTLAKSVGLLSGVAGVLVLVAASHDLFRKVDVADALLAIPIGLVLLYTAAASFNPSSLNLTVEAKADAAREAIGISMLLVKVPLRLVPAAFGLYSLLAAGSAIFFAYQLTGDEIDLYFAGALEIAPWALMVGLLPMAFYLTSTFGTLVVDAFRSSLDTADATRDLAEVLKAGKPVTEE